MKFTSPQHKLIIETDQEIRTRERSMHSGGPDDRAKYRQDLRRKLGLEQVEVVRCLGIYKAYKYGPDSVNFLFVGNKELADIATTMLDENDNGINYIEGGEFAAWWDSKTAIAELDDVLLTSEEVVAAVEEIRAE